LVFRWHCRGSHRPATAATHTTDDDHHLADVN
jgi:hypothetical protein